MYNFKIKSGIRIKDKGLLIGFLVKGQGHSSGPFLNERLRHVLIHMQTKYAGIGPKYKIY